MLAVRATRIRHAGVDLLLDGDPARGRVALKGRVALIALQTGAHCLVVDDIADSIDPTCVLVTWVLALDVDTGEVVGTVTVRDTFRSEMKEAFKICRKFEGLNASCAKFCLISLLPLQGVSDKSGQFFVGVPG